MDDGYFSEELELREQHDLEAMSDDDSRSDRSLGSRHTGDDSDGEDDDDDDIQEPTAEHLQVLRSTVVEILSAMGGLEEVEAANGDIESVYVMGDDVLRCLRDLRTLWREDEEDQSRLIPRIFSEVSVMQNGLIPLLLKSASMGEKGGKIALACTDLMMSMTWPIDTNAELKAAVERNASEERLRSIAKLTTLEQALVTYKAAVLRIQSGETRGTGKDVLSSIMLYVLLPALSKPRPMRSERDIGTISLCLHFFRNLLAIRDPPATTLSSAEAISMAQLQSELVVAMSRAHILDTILTIASSADQRDLEPWSAVAAECIYFIFAGTRLAVLVPGSSEAKLLASQEADAATLAGKRAPSLNATAATSAKSREKTSALSATLNAEARTKRSQLLTAGSSRHSRFGTSINFTGSDGQKRVARTQAALRKTSEQLMLEAQEKYRRKTRRKRQMQEKGAPVLRMEWSRTARTVLIEWTNRFMRLGFETLTLSLFEDIAKERAKVGNPDEARVRLMYLLAFFLDYFMLQRQIEQAKLAAVKRAAPSGPLSESTAANATAVLPAANDKGKARAIDEPVTTSEGDGSANTDGAQPVTEPAKQAEPQTTWTFDIVQAWLDPKLIRLAVVRTEKAMEEKHRLEVATAVHLWITSLRLIDLLAQSPDLAEREASEGIQVAVYHKGDTLEIFKTFVKSYSAQSFEYLDAVISLAYLQPKMLERFSSNKDALFIKAKARVKKAKALAAAEGIDDDVVNVDEAAKHHTEELYKERRFEFQKFQSAMISPTLVRACVTYLRRWADFNNPAEQLAHVLAVMHRFAIKASQVEVFYPFDIRSSLRDIAAGPMISALEPRAPTQTADAKKLIDFIMRRFKKLTEEEQARYASGQRAPRALKAYKIPAEFKIDPSQGHMHDIGIAVALLIEKQKLARVMWVRQALDTTASIRRQTSAKPIDGAERGPTPDSDADGDEEVQRSRREPLVWEAHRLDYDGDESLQKDATLMPELKLLCRLVGFVSDEEDPYHWKWSIPGDISPDILDADAEYVSNYIRDPYQSGGVELKDFIKRIIRRKNAAGQVRRVIVSGDEESDYESETDGDANASGEDGELRGLKKLKAKRKRTHRRINPVAKRRPAVERFVQEDDLIDSDEEMALAEAGWRAKHDAMPSQPNSSQPMAPSQVTGMSSHARSANAEDAGNASDASSVRPERRARPKATATRAHHGGRGAGASSDSSSPGPSQGDRSSPPTSSLTLLRSPAVVKSKRRANAGLFLRRGDDDDEEDEEGEEEDQILSDAESEVRPLGHRATIVDSTGGSRGRSASASAEPSPSPSPSLAKASASRFASLKKRSLAIRGLESDSESHHSATSDKSSSKLTPTQQLRKTRPALLDDEEEEEEDQMADRDLDLDQLTGQGSKRRRTALAIFSDDDE